MGLSEASDSRERLQKKLANAAAALINNASADFGAAKMLSKDEARRIAAIIAKPPELLRKA
jgi:hypothetical protein